MKFDNTGVDRPKIYLPFEPSRCLLRKDLSRRASANSTIALWRPVMERAVGREKYRRLLTKAATTAAGVAELVWASTIVAGWPDGWGRRRPASPRCCVDPWGETPTLYYGDEIGGLRWRSAPNQVRDL